MDAAASGARMRAGRMMLMRTAKSCGSGAPMLASSLANFRGATVSNKPGHRGEREVSRKTIARGMPGLFRCTCGDYARVLHLISHARLWVHWAPGIPCALCLSRRELFLQNSGGSRRENAGSYLKLERRHCEERLVRHQRPRPPKLAKPRRKAEAKQPRIASGGSGLLRGDARREDSGVMCVTEPLS
jgi:hypothetical protein